MRQSLSPEEVSDAGEAVLDLLSSRNSRSRSGSVCVYASTGKEIPTRRLMEDLLAAGVLVAVPDWEAWRQGSGLRVLAIESTRELAHEGRVVPQPMVPDGRVSPAIDEFDQFIVPGLAFDRGGNRLGMGGGYFDRLLSYASPTATFTGLAYDFQVVTHLPVQDHDIPVHEVVTPGGLMVRKVDHKQEGKDHGS